MDVKDLKFSDSPNADKDIAITDFKNAFENLGKTETPLIELPPLPQNANDPLAFITANKPADMTEPKTDAPPINNSGGGATPAPAPETPVSGSEGVKNDLVPATIILLDMFISKLCGATASESSANYKITKDDRKDLEELILAVPEDQRPKLFNNAQLQMWVGISLVFSEPVMNAISVGAEKVNNGNHKIVSRFWKPSKADATKAIEKTAEKDNTLIDDLHEARKERKAASIKGLLFNANEKDRRYFQLDEQGRYIKTKDGTHIKDAERNELASDAVKFLIGKGKGNKEIKAIVLNPDAVFNTVA